MIVLWAVAGLLLILSIVLLTGKGSMLIAGYNTSSAEQKARYNSEKLSRAYGVMLLIITAAIVPLTFIHSQAMIIAFMILIIAAVVVTQIYADKRCKNPVSSGESMIGGKSRMSPAIAIVMIIPVVILLSVSFYIYGKPPVYSVSGGVFTIDTSYGESIALSDIKSVQLKNELPAGLSKIDGIDFGSIDKGKFTSKAGDATVFIDAGDPPFIYLDTTSGLVIVNNRSKIKTESLYNILNSDIRK